MTQDTSIYGKMAENIASRAGEAGGDLQRYVIAPAMIEMIGPIEGKDVLDLYCGAGYLSRRLKALGANVTAVDSSERLVGIAREISTRENERIDYAVAEPTDLSVIEDSTFDDIVCNMGLMMTRDLAGTVAELARLIKLGGRFIFSVVHPCFGMPDGCWIRDDGGRFLYKTVDNYFAEGWWSSELVGAARSKAKTKHRTLAEYVNALSARGFNVSRISEPRPSADTLVLKPHMSVHDRLPAAIIIEAVFPYL